MCSLLTSYSWSPVPNLFVTVRTFILVTAVLLSVNFGYSIMRVQAPAWVWAALSVRRSNRIQMIVRLAIDFLYI